MSQTGSTLPIYKPAEEERRQGALCPSIHLPRAPKGKATKALMIATLVPNICIGYFEATRGYVNKHISPRCLKITYTYFSHCEVALMSQNRNNS
jgi:hypothetical protein